MNSKYHKPIGKFNHNYGLCNGISIAFQIAIIYVQTKIMNKKLVILFIFTFFLSTTGVPISLHYCQMQGSLSLSDCGMCSSAEVEEEPSCCETEDSYPIQLKSDIQNNCCELKVIDSSVKENFLLIKQEIRTDKTDLFFTIFNNETFQKLNVVSAYSSFCDSSPPLIRTDIYLQNSVFLI